MRSVAAMLLALALLGACSTPPERPLARTDSPHGVVLVVHGAFPDSVFSSWDEDVVALVESRGALAAHLDYRCHGLEWLLTDEVARNGARVTRALQDLDAAHARTSCRSPLRVAGIGYSLGTVVLLEAALAGAKLHEVTFGGSPLFFASSNLGRALEEKRIEHLVNYCSLVDGLVWPMIPCGIWGYSGSGMGHVENRLTFQIHGVYPFAFHREEIADETLRSFGQDDHATCMKDVSFREAWRSVRHRLEDKSAE